MKILVTGATGFVGSNLCEELLKEKENKIIGISKQKINTKKIKHLLKNDKFKLINCDITDYKKLLDVLNKNEIDAVIHLAANLGSKKDLSNSVNMFKDNVIGTLNLLESCQKRGIQRIIYASTMNVYGKAKYLPVDEKHPTKPNNIYGFSKLMGEKCCIYYHKTYGINIII